MIEPGKPGERTALVTGANRGLGFETCRQLVRERIRVILTSRRTDAGLEAARRIETEDRGVRYHQLDVTMHDSITAVVDDFASLAPRLDILVNNAGVGSWDSDLETARRAIAVNYRGARDVTEALLPFMSDGGVIVMVSSGLGELSHMRGELRGRFADPNLTRDALDDLVSTYLGDVASGGRRGARWPSAYSVSKVALNSLTRILSRDLSGRGISVNAVCPGWVRTDMGGRRAPRSVPVGGRSIVLGVLLPHESTGGFYRDGRSIPW